MDYVDEYTVPGATTRNKFKVPQRQWRKWHAGARQVFNELYAVMKDNQHLFLWNGDKPRPKRRWTITAWNAAWLAADAAESAHRGA
jgi:hypothetical protein